MTPREREDLIETLLWISNGWTKEAFDAMDDKRLLEEYERRVGV